MGTYKTVKSAASAALQARRAIAQGDFWPFIPAFAFALSKDTLFDPLALIPIVGLIPMAFGLFISVYLFVFLWGKGAWKIRLVVFAMTFVDAIPGVGLVPVSTLSVWYVLHQAKATAKQAAQELPGYEAQTNAERTREYQRNYAEAEEERANRMAQEPANDVRQRVPLRNVV